MPYSDESYDIRIELDAENCEPSPGEIAQMEESLGPLREPLRNFPVVVLYVTVEYKPPSRDYRVTTALRLSGRDLVAGDVDEHMQPAFRRCVRTLVHKVSAYKDRLADAEGAAKHEQGTRHDVIAARAVDPDALGQAVAAGDYAEFRRLTFPFEESVRKRLGRWIQRYPRVEAELERGIVLADFVEEVFLNAFERYEEHPREVPFGDWLEGLIDPSVKRLSENPEEELTNISFARSALAADNDRPAE